MAELVLHLRPEEKKIFDGFSSDLQNGWKVQAEELEDTERFEELAMRQRMFRSGDEVCQKMLQAVTNAKSADDCKKVAAECDFASLSREQAAELFFTIGTGGLSSLIKGALELADTDEDLAGIAGSLRFAICS